MGKIYIDDAILKSKEWNVGEFNKWQALIDLYLLADKSGGWPAVKTSERKLSERWGWGRKKVRLFIEELRSKGTIKGTSEGTIKGTILSLENTGFIGVEGTTKGTIKGTSEGTTKNDKCRITFAEQKPEKYFPNDEKLNRAFIDFAEMRAGINVPMSDADIRIVMRRLQALSTDEQTGRMDNDRAIDILEQSTINHWKNIYPLKEDKRKQVDLASEWRKY